MVSISDTLAHAWNAFIEQPRLREASFNETSPGLGSYGRNYGPHTRLGVTNEKMILNSIYNRIGIDAAGMEIRHVIISENDMFSAEVPSGLNNCMQFVANKDQEARQFRQDVVMTLLEEGYIAIVPVDTGSEPMVGGITDIQTMRVGKITSWHPNHVEVDLYDDNDGAVKSLYLPKNIVAIVENPLYSVMNEPNSTLARLTNKLRVIDRIDGQNTSGKMDLILQLPYVIKSDARRGEAARRVKDLTDQLSGNNTYGIAYTDGTEKITQLNRPVTNNLMDEVEYLTEQLYVQLGLTPEVMNGTADEATMLNYYNRTIDPILTAITEALQARFLTKTARSQGHRVKFYRDPFHLVPISQIAEIADKFTRNEIATANEMRGAIGWTASSDAKANKLRNSNMPLKDTEEGLNSQDPPKDPSIPSIKEEKVE